MSFLDIKGAIQPNYDSLENNPTEEFFIPCLEQAIEYKRGVGYFSSNVLIQLSKGIGSLVDRGGKMKLLVSTRLSQEDYEAIKRGYEIKKYVEDKIINQFEDASDEIFQKKDRLEMLAYMVSHNILEVKIVALEEHNENGLFHKKIGIMYDKEGNRIAFSGSGNETLNALNYNSDDYDVYCSWYDSMDERRVDIKESSFDRIWEGYGKGLVTIPFPEVIKNNLLKFLNKKEGETIRYSDLDDKYKMYLVSKKTKSLDPQILVDKIPNGLFKYQIDAITTWKEKEYKGIFDMATGTGKTFAAGGAICELFKNKKRIVAVICCPYIHLVDQWCDEMHSFNINAIKCYGSIDYEKQLERALTKFKQRRSNFVCICICNGTFKKEKIQTLLKVNIDNTLLVVDEAHNFGSLGLSETLKLNYPYRLALSATLDRYGDEEGTNKLYDFFGEKCISYTLQEAILQDKLTPYEYYPIIVHLNDDEYGEYIELSKQISKCHGKDGGLTEYGKRLAIKRARLISGCKMKITELGNLLRDRKNENNMLIYCGAVKYGQFGYDDCSDEKRQIEVILSMLNKDFHIYASKFTSEENTDERKKILKAFKNQDLQALVAIKCLDEGMNIPAIKTAFILASSTNPKEYIQRRGRVLRKSEGKLFAEIYDFITLPTSLKNADVDSENINIERNLIRKELTRLVDFANLSRKPSRCNDIIKSIHDAFGLDTINEGEDWYD